MKKIVVVDDEADICFLLKRFLSKNDFIVETAQTGKDGLELIESFEPDLVMTDFRLGDITGTELLNAIKSKRPHVPVLIITGYSDIKVAVNVMKLGAYDYITKPLFPDEILVTVKKALADAESEKSGETEYVAGNTETATVTKPGRKTTHKMKAGYVMGQSEIADNLFRQVDLVAPTNFSVIIYGESGSGKEAIAHEIHNRSRRRDMPFVAMDCGAISKELAGSELFGHEKGSFTGALQTKIGHFEMANGGTLFLDEVSNLSYEIQVALLRVVQERKMRRIGGSKEIDLDVRIIVASNERLLDAARNGKFREDLYYRFNEFTIEVPALRNRKDDLLLFATTFLETTNGELGKNVKGFSDEVMKDFVNYSWPGNLRELKNVIKRATLLSDGELIEEKSLPFEIVNYSKLKDLDEEISAPVVAAPASQEVADTEDSKPSLKTVANEAEYDMIMQVLRDVNFNKSKAARLLNIDRKTLYNKMKQFDI
ncbi:two-component system, NtrC family, response regulator HydG [Dyadobacter koreensis]|uniref:Two-component system, NtrC family, response regulator HydG n=1 Tax=Dyadobacter koreensis TaxID=408657 RepID=A0A1H6RGX9_9BACT|nr:sigma-54 dependent transcriptional regulator [Dyadobacter koreensis]SEI55088.1 two-component system, NtrC family, response regulator HydG [Dyadobacter koreensis]